MATDADRAFLDTNVLLAATDEDRGDHRAATRVLNDSPALGVTLYLSGQILREYLVVASRPMDGNGLGLPMSSALANVDAFLGRTTVVEETLAVAARLRTLLSATASSGSRSTTPTWWRRWSCTASAPSSPRTSPTSGASPTS